MVLVKINRKKLNTQKRKQKAAKVESEMQFIFNHQTFKNIFIKIIQKHIDNGNFSKGEKSYLRDIKDAKVLFEFFMNGSEVLKPSLDKVIDIEVDDYHTFSEVMFLLLGGTGVGYSVQRNHVDKLPEITKPTKTRKYVIADSIEGWADAVKILCKAYFLGKPKPRFIFDDIRPKGAKLVTSGGKAPGPQPLKDCLHNIEKVFEAKENGSKLTTLECHDIMCYIADAVLAGGIRRAALISLFDVDDEDMLTCKFGNWWELNPQRGRANNSAVILRHRIQKDKFMEVWGKIKASGSGEPGIYLSNNADWGTNPCCEIALRPFQFCNLTEINMSTVKGQEDLNERARAASFLGTLQAGYTDFHYLRDVWKKTTERDALIGVSGTGIASRAVEKCDLREASSIVVEENKRVAELIEINPASRTTCIKPAGTTSLVLGTSSGIHAWYAPYYIRRIRLGKNESLYNYVSKKLPELVEDCFFKPNIEAVLSIPVKAPSGGIFRDESALDLLERIKKFSVEWVKNGHVKGENTHNVSATVSIKDDEWKEVGEWMWKNRDYYNGLAVLPYDGGTYKQAPFEEITKEEYDKLLKTLKKVDLTKISEDEDNTKLQSELACSGDSCEIK